MESQGFPTICAVKKESAYGHVGTLVLYFRLYWFEEFLHNPSAERQISSAGRRGERLALHAPARFGCSGNFRSLAQPRRGRCAQSAPTRLYDSIAVLPQTRRCKSALHLHPRRHVRSEALCAAGGSIKTATARKMVIGKNGRGQAIGQHHPSFFCKYSTVSPRQPRIALSQCSRMSVLDRAASCFWSAERISACCWAEASRIEARWK